MKIRYTWFLCTLLFCVSLTSFSQNLLYLHSNRDRQLHLVDLDKCSSTIVGSMPDVMYDIAMSPDGQLYGISANKKLYIIDKSQATGVLITVLPNYSINALVYGADDFLYGADGIGNILKINPKDGSATNLGRCGYASGGDLTFYEGTLYLAGGAGELVKIDLNRPANSRLIGRMNAPDILGLITVGTTDCQGTKPKVYATSNNKLYEVDLVTAKVKEACTLSVFSIGGAASLAEASRIKKISAGKDSTLTVCYGTSNTLNLFNYLTGGESGGVWKDVDNSQALSVNTLNPKTLKTGLYRFQYAIGEGLCADTAIVSVRIPTVIRIDKLQLKSPGCNSENGEIVVTTTNTNEKILYALDTRLFQSDNNFKNLKSGTYKISIQTQIGCKTDSTVVLKPSDAPQLATKKNDPQCKNGTGGIEITATGGTGLLVYSINGVDFQNQPIFTNLQSGNYVATVKDANNCTATQPITLIVTAGPEIVAINAKSTTCGLVNGSITINAGKGSGTLQYSIDGTTYQSASQFSSLSNGSYQPTVRDAMGCITAANQKIGIEASTKPVISLKVDPTECGLTNGKVLINGVGAGTLSYAINVGIFQPQPLFENLSKGTYEAVVKDVFNCEVKQSFLIEEKCTESVYLPSAFSPNNDGSNDTWTIHFLQKDLKINSITIFNRWGNVIHFLQNIDVQNGASIWNGKDKENPTKGDVFTYQLDVQFQTDHNQVYVGTVQVLY